MSAMFAKLTTDGLEESGDRLGGYAPKETDIYIGKIKAMYAGQSSGGAMSVTVILALNDGTEYRETAYVTNKQGQNYFLNKNDKTKKVPLPGFTVIDDLCLIATGKPLAEQTTEEKVVQVYDPEHKKEMPKAVPMLMETLGQEVAVGIVKQLENKNKKEGNEYVPTAETRESNFIDKVYHPELKLTVAEARNGQEEAKFWDAWLNKNKGQVRDKREIKDGQAGTTGAPPKAAPTAGSQAPRKSLFAK